MAQRESPDQPTAPPPGGIVFEPHDNPWAAPLRTMYQQVVEEPLPDFLTDLIQRLDQEGQ